MPGNGDSKEASAIAEKHYVDSVNSRFHDAEFTGDADSLISTFRDRIALVDWNHAVEAEGAFRESPKALVRWAPIEEKIERIRPRDR